MRKYEVPVVTVLKLNPFWILNGSTPFEDNSEMNTERYIEDDDFDADNLYD